MTEEERLTISYLKAKMRKTQEHQAKLRAERRANRKPLTPEQEDYRMRFMAGFYRACGYEVEIEDPEQPPEQPPEQNLDKEPEQ